MKKTILVAALSSLMMMNATAQNKTFDASYMDKSVAPSEDFFQFANGMWVKNNPVPKTESRWGSFNELQLENYKKIEKIFKDLEAAKKLDIDGQNLSNYYQSYINKSRNENNYIGLKTITEIINSIKVGEVSSEEFAITVAKLHSMGINVFFDLGVEQDLKNNTIHVPYLSQPRLGLPNKSYYEGDKLNKYQANYVKYIASITNGVQGMRVPSQAKIEAKGQSLQRFAEGILKTEMQLSKAMFSPEELRDIARSYNPMEISKLKELVPNFNWDAYFKTLGVDMSQIKFFVVSQVPYFESFEKFLQSNDETTIENYIKFNVVNSLATYADMKHHDLHFDFYQKFLLGKQEKKPIIEEAIDNITVLPIGEVLGKEFVEYYFGKEATAKINTLVDNLFIAFRERIEGLTWMSPETKKQALVKLSSFTRKLAYPEKWKDFTDLKELSKDNLTQNIINLRQFAVRDNLNDLGRPIDKLKWEMPAHMVNAYYNPLLNEIAFPAGIMQAPFFDVNFEDAVNYARMGMVIGHELTHGFDDQGAQFTADGQFSNWWTDEDKKKFDKLTKTYGETFANFCPFDGVCVNPNLTMGENIADLGGITLAYHAYMRTPEFQSGKKINGYTPAQRFFISYAQIWKTTYTDEELKNRIENDPHSPGMYRVNGPLMNTPEFFEAFDIKENQPMRNKKGKMTVIW